MTKHVHPSNITSKVITMLYLWVDLIHNIFPFDVLQYN